MLDDLFFTGMVVAVDFWCSGIDYSSFNLFLRVVGIERSSIDPKLLNLPRFLIESPLYVSLATESLFDIFFI